MEGWEEGWSAGGVAGCGGVCGGSDRDACFSDTHGNVKGTESLLKVRVKSAGRGILGIWFGA